VLLRREGHSVNNTCGSQKQSMAEFLIKQVPCSGKVALCLVRLRGTSVKSATVIHWAAIGVSHVDSKVCHSI
jgi:hypothetical protein